jgi:putative ATPase
MNLAIKYRPKRLDDILSQEHLVGKEGVFREFIKNGYFPNILLFGKPGCGKTTLTRVIAKELNCDFFEFNATSIKIDDIRKVLKSYEGKLIKPLIFIDEVHRLNKSQQEVLLPFLEEGNLIFIGASTQNPYYSLTSAFRSRVHLFSLNEIKNEDIKNRLLYIAKNEGFNLDKEALEFLISSSNGDLRAAINLLESASYLDKNITLLNLQKIRPKALSSGSSENEEHYNLASALIKSVRGSDIDASIYYLARLIESGEPPEFIARRLAILASEDIGNANPNALNLASSALNIVKFIGYPEARIVLAQLTIYLASSPKSNSVYKAINSAQKAIKEGLILDIPKHLINKSKNYLYPHDFGGFVEQKYLEKELKFYKSCGIGFEKTLDEWLSKIKTSNKNN